MVRPPTSSAPHAASDDARLAADLAREAASLLVQLRDRPDVAALSAEDRGRLGDLKSNTLILDRLKLARPDDAILSEESPDDPARLDAERVWIIDPLDGTREFVMSDRRDWAVHVALWTRGEGITAAAVALPAQGTLHTTEPSLDSGAPAGRPSRNAGHQQTGGAVAPRIVVSESRPPEFTELFAQRLGATVEPMGSAGAKAMAVVEGVADLYVHAGGQWEWDSAAPVGVALNAGLHASRIDGSHLRYNQRRPFVADLLICHADLAGRAISALADCTRKL